MPSTEAIEQKVLDMVAKLRAEGGQPTEENIVKLSVAAFDELMADELARSLQRIEGKPETVKTAYTAAFHQAHDEARSKWLPGIIAAARSLAANSLSSIEVGARIATGPTIH